MTILGNGNVGIGSINPGHLLDVLKSGSGDATIRIRTTTGGDPTIIFNSAAANRSGLIKYQDNGTNVGRIEYVHNGDRIDLQAGSATGATMSVLNGKVGINTSTLTNAFHVDGNARIEGNLMAGGAAASNVPARPIHVKSAGDAAAIRIEDTTSSNLAYDLRSTFGTGLLFVDVTNGATRMTIKDSGAINFNGAYTFPTSDGSSGQVLQTDGSGNLSFATSSGGVTLSNGANNRIVTASSASAINGEANLQYDGSALDIYTGSIPVTDNHVGLTFRQTGTYSDGRYEHRFRKRDEGGGIPLYIDKTSSTANAHTAIVRFGSYTSNPEEFEVYGQAKITGNLQLSAGLLKFTTNNHILTTHNGNNIELRSGTTGSMGILGRNSNADFRFQVYGDGSSYGFLDGAWAGWDIKKTINGQLQIDEGSGLNKVWTSGNDGAGSGLDADTIDGLSFIEHQGVSKQISITVNGASDKYYPVVISGLNHEAGHEVKIERGYAETGPNDWYTSTHKGGLSLRVTIAGASGWGGYPNIYTVDEFGEIYSRICGGMKYTAHTMKFLVWLRGGTAAYRIFTKAANASVVVYDDTSSGYTSGSGWLVYDHSNSSYDVYEDLRDQTAADTGAKNEIIAKMPVRAGGTTKANQINYYAGGTTLSGGNLYWNDANDGSGSGLDADTLDSVQASGFLRSNTSDTFTSGTLTFGSGTSFDTATNDVYPSMRVIRNNKSGSDGMYLGYANSNSGATRIYGGGATSGGIRVQGSGNNDIIMGSSSGTAWHSANDGANSGLDADLLDGQHGSYYRNASNINAGTLSSGRMPSTPPNTYIYGTDTLGAFDSTTFAVNPPRMGFFNINNSSAENPAGFGYWQGLHFRHNNQSSTWGWQLAGTYNSSYPDLYFRQVASASRGSWYKIWSTNNDGSGSGLDADTVDGVQAGDLARISTSNVFGSPNFNISNYFRRNNTSNYTNAPLLVESYGGAGSVTGVGFHISGQVGRFLYMSDSGVLYWNDSSSKIWHASNDGSGSGLDADTLDSYHASYFTPKDHIRSLGVTAFTSGSNPNITTAQYISEMESDGAFDSYSSVFKTSWSYAGNYNLSDAGTFGPTETAGMSHITWTDNSNDSTRGTITVLAIAPTTGGSAGGVYVYNDQGSGYAPGWREIWTSSTDGAGSGLDADLLDGQHASAFLTSVPNHSANLITSGTVSAARLPSPLSSLHSDAVTGSALATTGSPHSVLEYQQASSISDTKLAPSGDWHNTIRMGHGNPYSYYSNTIALRMTGSGLGDLYTQTISNNNAQGWNKHWHTNNDGSGSGLDADLLDGQHASALLTDGSIYLRSNASDTFGSTSSNQYIRFNCNSGQYIASGGSSSRFPIEIFAPTANGGDAGITFHISNDYAGFFGLASDWNDLAWGGWSVGSTTKYRIAHTGNFSSTGIWYNGNDGSGSGLDADTLDGQHGSYYEPASTNLYKHRGSVNVTSSSGGSNSNPFDDAHTETRVAENGSRLIHYTGASASMFSINVGGSASVFQIGAHYDGNNFYMRTRTDSSNWQTWKKLWHNGNDGSGSGLDADRLDGLDSGSFLRSDTNDTATGHITLGASTKIIFGNNSSYGIGAQGHNYRSGYFDTLESGGATDPLELIYYVGNKVNIGPGGNKPMNAGSYQVNGTEIVTSARALTNITGITTTGALNMSNQQIYGVNNLRFNDPGVQEGIKWDGGNQWQIYESPNNQTNASGNLQFTSGSGNGTIRMTLDTSGNVTATGDVTAFSDERLKTNIQTLDGKKALQMRGVSFEKNGEQGSGVIAQELEKIAPELVHTSDDDMQTKSVAYGNLVGYLIEAIKDQQKQIDELKEKLNI